MKLVGIIVGVLLLLTLAGVGVYYTWFHQGDDVTPPTDEVNVTVGEETGGDDANLFGNVTDTDAEPDFGFGDEGNTSRAVPEPPTETGEVLPIADTTETGGDPFGETIDLNPVTDDPLFGGTDTAGNNVVIDPLATETPTAVRTERPVTITVVPESTTPAVSTTKPVVATTTQSVDSQSTVASVASGNYSVQTSTPVFESKLPSIRTAMKKFGVKLQEQRSGQSQRITATRVAIGYFRSKTDAVTWAQNYLRPRNIQYFAFPVQNMYSIQVGVYAEQQNADQKMRELYQKFPGWRLPVRTEQVGISKTAYHLSIKNITESLGRSIQNTLVQMGVKAELAGI